MKSDIKELFAPIQDEMDAFQDALWGHLETNVDLIDDVQGHILSSGGKHIRAAIALSSSLICGLGAPMRYDNAVVIELIHLACLLHDDVVDEAPKRRHQPSANILFGNALAVLAGDFLYSRASQILARSGSVKMLNKVAEATNMIAEGEVLQLAGKKKRLTDEASCIDVIDRKTAKLFQIAGEIGPVLGAKDEWEAPLGQFGRHIGIAFQLADDCLDYIGDDTKTGKQAGRDLMEGKMTLPLLYAFQSSCPTQKVTLENALKMFSDEPEKAIDDGVFLDVKNILLETGALDKVSMRAHKEATNAALALEVIPESEPRSFLKDLSVYAVERNF